MNKIKLCAVLAVLLPSAGAFSQQVNPFDGSLNYQKPLFSIPSPNGDAIPIQLLYGGSGIGVDQPASEVGLGWTLSAGGSITRSVSGIPDDFSGKMFNQAKQQFQWQTGCLIDPSANPGATADIVSSRRNLDSVDFHFPDYDTYNVSGPGIGGSLMPMLLNYLAFKDDGNKDGGFTTDLTNSHAWKTPRFIFKGDFADTLVSRHYPDPVYSATPFRMPNDVVSGACYGDATSYYGKKGTGTGLTCSENYDPSTNRLATPNYVEYTIDPYGVLGITSFSVTNSAGFMYRYTLPVYTNYSVTYNYPLANDYSMLNYTNGFTRDVKTYTGSYYDVEHQFVAGVPTSTYVIENNSLAKYVMEWKLTSITGPDYVDADYSGTVSAGDQGYWVIFDYKLWTNNFTTRYPAYGFNYYSGADDKTENLGMSDPLKISGKFATASVVNKEVYYLNSIQTSTHKAYFVRDIRQDEVSSSADYDNGFQDSIRIDQTDPVASLHGNIFDDGGTANYSGTGSFTKTIHLGKVSNVTLNFRELGLSSSGPNYDKLHIYAGASATGPEISFITYGPVTHTAPFTSANPVPTNVDIGLTGYTAEDITFKFEKVSSISAAGFNVEWHASGEKRTPQLYVKRILLFEYGLTTPSLIPLADSTGKFDLSGTTNATSPLLNETWYRANQAMLTANSLKAAFLYFDYSLANKYYRNINCEDDYRNTRLSPPAQVLQNLNVNPVAGGTGKLTLNKIVSTDLSGVKILPSSKFDYNAAIATDNPDYNPGKVDNWGFYKSDASSLGYYAYTTNTSKDFTDAWSLRKITEPLGGITEIEYEPNSYKQVSDGNGGYRPPFRIFPISSFSINLSYYSPILELNLEEGTNLGADLTEVYNGSLPPEGEIFLPVNVPATGSPAVLYHYYGLLYFNYNASSPLPILPGIIEQRTAADPATPAATTYSYNPYIYDIYGGDYTGNGWVRFQVPDGIPAYGGGNRVKKITLHNGPTDAYSTLYEYEGGTALNEADRFEYNRYKYTNHPTYKMLSQLRPFGSDKFEMRPEIGYQTVRIKNLGQVNAAKGWTELTYNTFGSVPDNIRTGNPDNYAVGISQQQIYTSYGTDRGVSCSRSDTGYVLEYTDQFSPFWGLMTEQKQYDVNNNMLSRTVMEYAPTQQGALVENFVFAIHAVDPVTHGAGIAPPCLFFTTPVVSYQACVKRDYPAVLLRSTTFGMSTRTITQPLVRDEITGEVTTVQVSSDNRTSELSIKKPAFRISTYATMGPKSVNPAWSNILGADAYDYTSTDTTLSVTAGLPGVNFSSADAAVFSKSGLVRSFDGGSHTFVTTASTTLPWYNNQSYGWAGTQGSLDGYGLYKSAELASNPFNFTTPASSNIRWRLKSEVSMLDDQHHILETRSFNNKFSATRFDVSGRYVIAQINNCNYKSFTYSGFENSNGAGFVDGEVKLPTGSSLSAYVPPHTGAREVIVYSGAMGPSYAVATETAGPNGELRGLLVGRIYRASVWVHNTSATGARLVLNLNGNIGGVVTNSTVAMSINSSAAVTVDNWQLLAVDIKVPSNYVSAGGSTNSLTAYLEVQGSGYAFFDDFMLRPVETALNAKVYEAVSGRITADINSDGYSTQYSFDAAGNVIDTYKEIPGNTLLQTGHKTYHYARTD